IENYITTFTRVTILVGRRYTDDEIAFVIRRSSPLVAAYRKLYDEYQSKPTAQRRLKEILARVEAPRSSAKKGGRLPWANTRRQRRDRTMPMIARPSRAFCPICPTPIFQACLVR